MFIDGLTISFDENQKVITHLNYNVIEEAKRIGKVLDESKPLLMVGRNYYKYKRSLNFDQNEKIHLYKHYSHFNKDVQTLRLAQGSVNSAENGIQTSLRDNKVSIKTANTLVTISYVTFGRKAHSQNSIDFNTIDTEYNKLDKT